MADAEWFGISQVLVSPIDCEKFASGDSATLAPIPVVQRRAYTTLRKLADAVIDGPERVILGKADDRIVYETVARLERRIPAESWESWRLFRATDDDTDALRTARWYLAESEVWEPNTETSLPVATTTILDTDGVVAVRDALRFIDEGQWVLSPRAVIDDWHDWYGESEVWSWFRSEEWGGYEIGWPGKAVLGSLTVLCTELADVFQALATKGETVRPTQSLEIDYGRSDYGGLCLELPIGS